MNLEDLHIQYNETGLHGRYITNDHIKPLLDKLSAQFIVEVGGISVMQKPIYSILAGSGDTRIFIWSQMHGNESTTTKAIFDLLNFLGGGSDLANQFLSHFTLYILPMVNPDGAELYTRENANKVDLNRDSVNLTQPESILLREAFDGFKPHYAYNMHDQRSIFGAGDGGLPATVSFLAPSYNDEREINEERQKAINLIVAMNDTLQHYIPGKVGRFDDAFNINCIGDMFQSLGVPTILFEAGHYQNDYEREKTRKYLFFALLTGFNAIYENVIAVNKSIDYFNIPQNKINFYDIICKNVKINYENKQIMTNFAIHYSEIVIENTVKFKAFIREIGNLDGFHAHMEYDGRGAVFLGNDDSQLPKCGEKADFYLGPDRKFVNGREIM